MTLKKFHSLLLKRRRGVFCAFVAVSGGNLTCLPDTFGARNALVLAREKTWVKSK
jgi:hypothetical protein